MFALRFVKQTLFIPSIHFFAYDNLEADCVLDILLHCIHILLDGDRTCDDVFFEFRLKNIIFNLLCNISMC